MERPVTWRIHIIGVKKPVNSWTHMGTILLEIFIGIPCCLNLMTNGHWKADLSFCPGFGARLY